MARIDNLTNFLTDVATAIKTKKGITDPILAANFDTEIETIETSIIELVDGAKIFNSVDEMKSDNTSVAGDMAIVYNTGIVPSSPDVYFRRLYCPKTIAIPGIEPSVNKWSLVSDDGSIGTTSMNISAYSSIIKFTTPEGTINVSYRRDGTTSVYNREMFNGPGISGDAIVFDRDVHFVRTNADDTTSAWSPAISQLLQIDNLNFEGLFKYVENQDIGLYIKVPLVSGFHYEESFVWDKTYYDKPLDINTAAQIAKKIKSEQGYNYTYASIFVNSNGDVCMAAILPSDEYIYANQRMLDSLSFNSNGIYEGLGFRDSSSESIESVGKAQICIYKLNMDDMTYTMVSDKLSYSWQGTNNSYDRVTVYSVDMITAPCIITVDKGANNGLAGSMFKRNDTIFTFYNLPYNDASYKDTTYYYTGYISADMPFTAISEDLLLGKTAYTNGGVIVGTAAPSIDTSDATLNASIDMIKGRIAYGKDGRKIVGTLTDHRFTDELPGNFRGMSDDVENNSIIMYNGADTDIEDFATSTGTTLITSIPYTDMSNAIGLTADKIATGNTILGIKGTASGGGLDTSDATAVARDLVKDKTAYVNGEKIIGTRTEVINYGANEATYIKDKNYLGLNISYDIAINGGSMVLRRR